jgi:hypothetical protein
MLRRSWQGNRAGALDLIWFQGIGALGRKLDGKEFDVKDYAASMERLLNANHIRIESFGLPSKQREHLALGPAPPSEREKS